MKRYALLFLALLLSLPTVQADVTVSSLYSDHMVLQRDKANLLWGWADAGETINVNFDGYTRRTKADADGNWSVTLPKMSLGAPKTLTVKGKNTVTVKDILMGDVWVCSGQSNMGWSVSRSHDAVNESAAANYPEIRYYQVPLTVALKPIKDANGSWVHTTPETVPNFSAVGYFFGRQLHKDLKVPIGLIGTAWGGTAIESWISQDATEISATFDRLNNDWKPDVAKLGPDLYSWYNVRGKDRIAKPKTKRGIGGAPNVPSFNYNAMIAPLGQFSIKGAIWYQGESNAGRAYQYRDLQQTMITDWRNQFDQGDFPFFITQLANFRERNDQPVESEWAELREAQSMAARDMNNVGIACIIEKGDAKDIHPRNKQAVGYRLAQNALNVAYGHKDVMPAGPTYKSMKIKGNTAIISFDNVGKGLEARYGVKGFAICGADKKFVWADAKIVGKKVHVSADSVVNPIAIRYGWSNNPEVSLNNSDNLPTSPFRTDDFPMLTRDKW